MHDSGLILLEFLVCLEYYYTRNMWLCGQEFLSAPLNYLNNVSDLYHSFGTKNSKLISHYVLNNIVW